MGAAYERGCAVSERNTYEGTCFPLQPLLALCPSEAVDESLASPGSQLGKGSPPGSSWEESHSPQCSGRRERIFRTCSAFGWVLEDFRPHPSYASLQGTSRACPRMGAGGWGAGGLGVCVCRYPPRALGMPGQPGNLKTDDLRYEPQICQFLVPLLSLSETRRVLPPLFTPGRDQPQGDCRKLSPCSPN